MNKMREKKNRKQFSHCILWLCMLLIAHPVFAQNDQIKLRGTVLDENGESIIGASVTAIGLPMGTVTDLEGKFTLNVKPNAIVQISYMGFVSQNINVNRRTEITVILKEDTKELNEVVITALGINRDTKSLPYRTQSVDTEGLDETRDPNLLNMLSGKVAGVQFISNGGALSSTRVVIRGENSVTGDNQPLYVIDGVPIMNNMGDDAELGLDFGNAASAINPDDVENVEVLSGANASALYGSDAANGVILITTKKASRKSGLGITFKSNIQFNKLNQFPAYQNMYGAGINGILNGYNFQGQNGWDPEMPLNIPNMTTSAFGQQSFGLPLLGFQVIGRDGQLKGYSPAPETITNMYEMGTQITNSVSVDRATDLLSFRFSYTNVDYDDILDNFNEMSRNTFNLRTTAKIAKFLDADVSVQYVKENVSNRGYRSDNPRNPLNVITNLPRDASYRELQTWKHEDGTPIVNNGFYNPYWLLNEMSNADNKDWLLASLTLNLTFTNYLKLRLKASSDYQASEGWDFTNYYTPFDTDGQYNERQSKAFNNNYEALLMFNKRFGKFSLIANAGTSNQKQERKELISNVGSLLMPNVKSLANNAGTASTGQRYLAKEKIGVYGQANIGYKDFVYLDATARNDWSSTLPSPHSYFYYSGGASFILTEALKINKKILSYAKFRASYAKTGKDANFDDLLNGYLYGGFFKGNMTWYAGEAVSKNATLKPEHTTSTEFGGDFRFLNNRLSVDFTYYQKSTKNQIIRSSVSASSGFSSRMFNSGEVQNKGYELSVRATPVKTKKFEWSVSANWSKNISKVKSLMEGVERIELANWNGRSVQIFAEVGQPYGVMYGVDYKYNENGDILCDAAGRPKSADETVCFGKVSPDWLAGISNTFRYKDFDLGFHADFKKGGLLWSYSMYQGCRYGNSIESLHGRDEWIMSQIILGENDTERKGYLEANRTNSNQNYQYGYIDAGRDNGAMLSGRRVYDDEVPDLAGQECINGLKPTNYYSDDVLKSMRRYLYDASYIKLRTVSVGYNLPKSLLIKTPFSSIRVAAVGRNVWTFHQKTPKGLDPEATSSSGNGQGIEKGFNLPQANYGFDIKISF
jgi:TonB-linked SusC/RagA family outer membrane protein